MTTITQHDTLVCTAALLPPATPSGRPTTTIGVGSVFASAGALAHPALVTLPDATTVSLAGTDLIDPLVVCPVLSDAMSLTMPTGVDLYAAYAAAGKPLVAGDRFSFFLISGHLDDSISLIQNTGVVFANGASPLTIISNMTVMVSCTLDAIAPTPSFTVRFLISYIPLI